MQAAKADGFHIPILKQPHLKRRGFCAKKAPGRSRKPRKRGLKRKSPAARYSYRLAPATFATAVLNFCVRDGNRCDHRAITTRLFLRHGSLFFEHRILRIARS